MPDADIRRVFERLDLIGERLARVETLLEDMADRRLTALESRPDRLWGIGASVAAVISTAAAIVAWIRSL